MNVANGLATCSAEIVPNEQYCDATRRDEVGATIWIAVAYHPYTQKFHVYSGAFVGGMFGHFCWT